MTIRKLLSFRFSMITVSILFCGLLSACSMRQQVKKDSEKTPENDSITVEFNDNAQTFRLDEEYYFRLNTQIDKKSILVTSNNGLIKLSDNEEFDFVIFPKKHGELTLRFYESKNGLKTEIYTTNLMIE